MFRPYYNKYGHVPIYFFIWAHMGLYGSIWIHVEAIWDPDVPRVPGPFCSERKSYTFCAQIYGTCVKTCGCTFTSVYKCAAPSMHR